MKDLGTLHHFLGVTVVCQPLGLHLHQRQYSIEILSVLAWQIANFAALRLMPLPNCQQQQILSQIQRIFAALPEHFSHFHLP